MCINSVKKEIKRLEDNLKVVLLLTTYSLTNNTEIINVINKLGHGVSYKVLMETHTKNAYKIFEQQLEYTFILPLDYQKDECTIYIAENIDHKEKTLSDKKIPIFKFLHSTSRI